MAVMGTAGALIPVQDYQVPGIYTTPIKYLPGTVVKTLATIEVRYLSLTEAIMAEV